MKIKKKYTEGKNTLVILTHRMALDSSQDMRCFESLSLYLNVYNILSFESTTAVYCC